jgi:hypothetical protein
MTCNYCASIDVEKWIGHRKFPHHSAFKELEACAAGSKCHLCEFIAHDLKKEYYLDGLQSSDYGEAKIYYGFCRERFPERDNTVAAAESRYQLSHMEFYAIDSQSIINGSIVEYEVFVGGGRYA